MNEPCLCRPARRHEDCAICGTKYRKGEICGVCRARGAKGAVIVGTRAVACARHRKRRRSRARAAEVAGVAVALLLAVLPTIVLAQQVPPAGFGYHPAPAAPTYQYVVPLEALPRRETTTIRELPNGDVRIETRRYGNSSSGVGRMRLESGRWSSERR